MRNRLAITLVVVALFIGLAMAFSLAWWVSKHRPVSGMLNTASVVQQIQSLSEFVTVKYVIEKVVAYEDPKYFADLIPLGENKLILLGHGVVKAGVDLSRLRKEDVQVTDKRISIELPPATLTDAYLDEKHTQVLDHQTGLLRTFDKNLERTARQHALAEIQRAARQSGIENEANERARIQLTNFLKTLGFAEVEIRTRGK